MEEPSCSGEVESCSHLDDWDGELGGLFSGGVGCPGQAVVGGVGGVGVGAKGCGTGLEDG